jgi:hypothetical protein
VYKLRDVGYNVRVEEFDSSSILSTVNVGTQINGINL